MHSRLHDVVSALVWAITDTHRDDANPLLQPPYNDLTQFILRQHARMPDYLRTPLAALTHAFDLLACLHGGGCFHRQPPADRQKRILRWRNSPSSYKRDLMRFYEALTVFALHSRTESRSRRRKEAECEIRIPNSEIRNGGDLRCEICVIGSGPGGSITAALLAEAGRDVLMLEEGPFLPLDSCAPFSLDEMEQKYRNGGLTVALGANKISYVEGRCVGGGSEINSGLYHRTPDAVLDNWRKEFRVEAISESDLNPHFEACERDLSVSLLPGPAPAASIKLHEGATKLGWQSLEVPRWFRYEEVEGRGSRGEGQIGRRQSMTQTFVPRFLNAGGRLVPEIRAHRIRQENGRWLVEATHSTGRMVRISAERLFVAGGAVQTPALLRRSGLNHHIGNSLRLHPTVKMVAQFPEEVNAADMGVPVHQVKEFAPRLSFGCSISSTPHLALALLDHPAAAREVTRAWTRQAIYYAMITGGTGTVRTVPGFGDPLVRYRISTKDRADLADGLRKLSELLFAAGATTVFPAISQSTPLTSPDDIRKLPGTLPSGTGNLMTIHLFSSCPMGEDRSKCATDSFGRVHGFGNLHIADASLLCGAPGVNPQGTIMALARRNALRLLGQL